MGYTINNTNKRITLTRGDTFRMQVAIFVNEELYTPEEGDSVRFALKQTYNSSKVLIHKDIPNDTLILHLQPEDTKRLAFGNYVYDIELTFADGDVNTFITGQFIIEPEVE